MNNNSFIGRKDNRDIYRNLLEELIPSKIKYYVEPFGGTFGLFRLIKKRVEYSVYNDIDVESYNNYSHQADESYNEDFELIINKFDSVDTFFYLDPPYYGKEFYYKE